MDYSKITSEGMPLLWKAICIMLIVCCVVIGLVGIVLPIIPGFLFLFFAALLLTKLSSRSKNLLHSNSNTRTWMRHWESSNSLSIIQRVKLSLWMIAKGAVVAVESGVQTLKAGRGKP